MKRAVIGLMALLIAITAIAATQYGRVQLTAGASLSHQFKDVQFVAHDFAPEAPGATCTGAAPTRALCSDGAGSFLLNLGTWTRFDVKVFSGAFGIANAELGDVIIDRIVCTDLVGVDLCDYMNITAHSNANLYCYAPTGTWQLAGAETGTCSSFWAFGAEVAAGTWTLDAACPTCVLPTGYSGGALTYGDDAGLTYAPLYDAVGDLVWESPGGNQPATTAVDTHVWIEVSLDFTTLAAVDANAGAQSALIEIVFSVPGP